MLRALEKRPVGIDAIEASLNELKFALRLRGEREVAAQELGSLVMDALRALDDVAYVRFASVYRDFQDVSEFQQEIERLGRSDGEPKA
jgi:transcriptional repressor NrdR